MLFFIDIFGVRRGLSSVLSCARGEYRQRSNAAPAAFKQLCIVNWKQQFYCMRGKCKTFALFSDKIISTHQRILKGQSRFQRRERRTTSASFVFIEIKSHYDKTTFRAAIKCAVNCTYLVVWGSYTFCSIGGVTCWAQRVEAIVTDCTYWTIDYFYYWYETTSTRIKFKTQIRIYIYIA